METINRNQVPGYLQKGSFFATLPGNLLRFEVPSNCLKADQSIETDRDLSHLLHSVRFWGVFKMPDEVVEYIMKSVKKSVLDAVLPTCPKFRDHIARVVATNVSEPIKTVVLTIRLRLAKNIVKFILEELGRGFDGWKLVALLDDVASTSYLQKEEVPMHAHTFLKDAASAGSLKSLMFARNSSCEFDPSVLECAARHGQTECVKFLHETCGIALSADAMVCAAESGKIGLICYLFKNQCPWDVRVCATLADKNNLKGLKFVRGKGCPWDGTTISSAQYRNHAECLNYALENKCPSDEINNRIRHFCTYAGSLFLFARSMRYRRVMYEHTWTMTRVLFDYMWYGYVTESKAKVLTVAHLLPLYAFMLVYSFNLLSLWSFLTCSFQYVLGFTKSAPPHAFLIFATILNVTLHEVAHFLRVVGV